MSLRTWLQRWLQESGSRTKQPSFEASLVSYETELKGLESGKSSPDSLLTLLLTRDQVAAALADEPASPQAVQRLVDLDRCLRRIAPRTPNPNWNAWCQALTPPPDRWWWRLKEKTDLPLTILTGLFITITLSLAVEIIQRMWGDGPDPLSIVSAVLTLALTGSPLTKRGRELAGWLMDKVRMPTRYRGETMLGAACLTFIVTLVLRLTLPALAVTFNNRGYSLLRAGDLTGAQRAFTRAVSLNPDYAAAYYNLANAYVEIADDRQAFALYNRALVTDRTFDLAYNGLGYVLIQQEKPERAIPILYTGLSLARDDTARVALLTNLGRAYLEAGRYRESETALTQALGLNAQDAAAHCTLALTAEVLARSEDEIVPHWENCLRYADPTMPQGQNLAAMARAHLRQLEEEK